VTALAARATAFMKHHDPAMKQGLTDGKRAVIL
jgi:hypothetical protein